MCACDERAVTRANVGKELNTAARKLKPTSLAIVFGRFMLSNGFRCVCIGKKQIDMKKVWNLLVSFAALGPSLYKNTKKVEIKTLLPRYMSVS